MVDKAAVESVTGMKILATMASAVLELMPAGLMTVLIAMTTVAVRYGYPTREEDDKKVVLA